MTGTKIFSKIYASREKKSDYVAGNCLSALVNNAIVWSVSNEKSFYVSANFSLLLGFKYEVQRGLATD